MSAVLTHNSFCRVCSGTKLKKVLSFGPTPLANAFLKKEDLRNEERYFPLDVYLCKECGLLQLTDIVAPEVLFRDYVYVSSTSPVFVAHFEKFAEKVHKRFKLGRESLVMDIGSNDGILLAPFKERGVRVLGIEPDKTIARMAEKKGIPTISEFFSPALARKIKKGFGSARTNFSKKNLRGQADIITATNVFAHINDIHEVAKGVKILLKKHGVFIIEVPYLVDFLEQNLFDTVYHEHLSYFSVSALNRFFKEVGMEIIDVERVETHGGSLRVYAQKKGVLERVTDAVKSFLNREKKMGLHKEEVYRDYAHRIGENRAKLLSLLAGLKQEGKRIAGYGAPAKGNTLLNFFSIGPDILEYIVDDSPQKQGKFTPGKRISVVSKETLEKDPPDYLLIMAWNFAPSIMKKNEAFRKRGGKFIIPVPTPRIVK
ncbi:MAG: class I SAM-dependent methyltransferase [bacterium]|nr:class I SAM-dependent methyltransferase [bacterium]